MFPVLICSPLDNTLYLNIMYCIYKLNNVFKMHLLHQWAYDTTL